MTELALPEANVRPNRGGMILAGGLLGVLAAVALVAALWTPYAVDVPDMAVALQDPNTVHWLGTDPAGRDVVSLLMKGLLTSFAIPICALVVAAIVGLPLGLGAARWPRAVGGVLGGADAVLVLFPAMFAAILLGTLWGASGMAATLALALSNIVPLARATRRAMNTLGARRYVEASRLAGSSGGKALRHVLPQIVSLVAAEAVTLFAMNAGFETSLSYLGLGVQPPAHSFGLMLREAQSYLGAKPLLVVLPGLLLTVLIAASTLAARGLRARARAGGSVGAA